MKGFTRKYAYQWPDSDWPNVYTRRYDSADSMAGRPIHPGMSVAPPEATTVWFCEGTSCGGEHIVAGGFLKRWWHIVSTGR